ncbi:MAG: translation elongation factor-like protein [Candidatus Omnitrophica bacterium]|nr:translation elongation factor-like protein [Candidatus Omnitrophota bacterium]
MAKRKVSKKLTKCKSKNKITKKRIIKPIRIKKEKLTTPKEKVVGIVTHYFPHVRAGVVKLKSALSLGDNIKIKGHTTDFTQTVTSMQINHVPIQKAKKGQEIGLLVESRVRKNDIVYKI